MRNNGKILSIYICSIKNKKLQYIVAYRLLKINQILKDKNRDYLIIALQKDIR